MSEVSEVSEVPTVIALTREKGLLGVLSPGGSQILPGRPALPRQEFFFVRADLPYERLIAGFAYASDSRRA